MIRYNSKKILEGNISIENQYRKEYLASISMFIENKYTESFKLIDSFMENTYERQKSYKSQFIEMTGRPVSLYPTNIPMPIKAYRRAILVHIRQASFFRP